MRKRLISAIPIERVALDRGGLDLANLGMVEITSEAEARAQRHASPASRRVAAHVHWDSFRLDAVVGAFLALWLDSLYPQGDAHSR